MIRAGRHLALLLACVSIAGCTQTAGLQPGLGFAAAPEAETSKELDAADQRAVQDAQYRALESGRTGAPVAWRNPGSGHSGEVTPGATYHVNAYECRDYTSTVTLGGQRQSSRATACKQPDGTWRPVT